MYTYCIFIQDKYKHMHRLDQALTCKSPVSLKALQSQLMTVLSQGMQVSSKSKV